MNARASNNQQRFRIAGAVGLLSVIAFAYLLIQKPESPALSYGLGLVAFVGVVAVALILRWENVVEWTKREVERESERIRLARAEREERKEKTERGRARVESVLGRR